MNRRSDTHIKKLAVLALLTAIVVVLQFMGSFIKFGMFSISLVLAPIVIGAALCGPAAGAYLGAVFGVVVLISGDAAPFLVVNPVGAVVTVMVKGICAGLGSGLVYKLLEKKSQSGAVIAAAVVSPILNTGIFLIGCLIFFFDTIVGWAEAMGFGQNVAEYMIVGLVGINFVVEFIINVVLSSVITRLIQIARKHRVGD